MDDTKSYPIRRFLEEVRSAARRDDRAFLAELRCGLSGGERQERAWEHLVPFCRDFENPESRAVWCTVGGLATTLIPEGLEATDSWHNLGTTMRALAKGRETGDEAKALQSFEPRFRRLLSCGDVLSLCDMLAGIGRAARAKGVPVNLEKLFWDLRDWNDPARNEDIRIRWAKQFFRVFEPAAAPAAPEGAAP